LINHKFILMIFLIYVRNNRFILLTYKDTSKNHNQFRLLKKKKKLLDKEIKK